MKLFEKLDKMKDEEIVAIGARDGNGYIYIGEAGNRELIKKCFDDCYGAIEKRLAKNKEKLEGLFVVPVQLDTEYKLDKMVELCNKTNAISKVSQAIISNIRYINTWVSPEDRDVVEIYHKEDDNCMAIIIKGLESNGFWDLKEFQKKYK